MEYAIETFSLTKIFSDWWGRAKVYAVDELNLKIEYNQVFGLLGPNGSGKTTTIKMLLGLLHPTKGKALILGGDGTDPKVNSRVGFLPEESYLYKYLSARETLDFYGRLFGLPPKLRKMRIEALLDMVGLQAVANRAVGTFSKGMARRIGLAQALINDPELLILDEPTTGLDPIGTRQIKDLVLKLAERGKTILLCSHLLADVEDVCDRIAILYGGKIQTQGQVGELLQQTNKRQIISDAISDSTIEQIEQLIKAENVRYEITSPMDKLESFFIRTVEEAQQKEHPTSGAVSTTRIGGFLTEDAPVDNILDKLVTASVSDQKPPKVESTEKVVQSKSETVEPDKKLLEQLSGSSEVSISRPVEENREVTTEKVDLREKPKQDVVKTDLLDRLTGRSKEQNEQEEKNNNSQSGGSGDG